jgi:hypothetical protein
MAFTYSASLATDLDLVRFYISDTSTEGHYIEDATITYFLTTLSVGATVIKCIRHIIGLLSVPTFKLDWFDADSKTAREGYEYLLKLRQQEFGIQSLTATQTITHTHRADSDENEDGVYDEPDGSSVA